MQSLLNRSGEWICNGLLIDRHPSSAVDTRASVMVNVGRSTVQQCISLNGSYLVWREGLRGPLCVSYDYYTLSHCWSSGQNNRAEQRRGVDQTADKKIAARDDEERLARCT